MKKTLIITFAFIATLALAQQPLKNGGAFSYIKDSNGTSSCVNYLGWARTNKDGSTPSTSNTVWRIVKETLDADGVVIESKNAYGDGVGDNSLWSTAWTNRVAATYK